MTARPYLSDHAKCAIKHALGLSPRRAGQHVGRRWAYRNYYAAGEGDVPLWDALVEAGLAIRNPMTGPAHDYPVYHVTQQGIMVAGLYHYIPRAIWGGAAK